MENSAVNYRAKIELGGRTALVTGAGQGIGAACAAALSMTGAKVWCTDIDLAKAAAIASGLQGATAETLDVTDTAALTQLATRLPPMDILICNAGIVANTPSVEMDDTEWERVIAVNLTGVFKSCRAFGKGMISRGKGSIVIIGSMSGLIINRPQAQIHYNASKAAVHHLLNRWR